MAGRSRSRRAASRRTSPRLEEQAPSPGPPASASEENAEPEAAPAVAAGTATEEEEESVSAQQTATRASRRSTRIRGRKREQQQASPTPSAHAARASRTSGRKRKSDNSETAGTSNAETASEEGGIDGVRQETESSLKDAEKVDPERHEIDGNEEAATPKRAARKRKHESVDGSGRKEEENDLKEPKEESAKNESEQSGKGDPERVNGDEEDEPPAKRQSRRRNHDKASSMGSIDSAPDETEPLSNSDGSASGSNLDNHAENEGKEEHQIAVRGSSAEEKKIYAEMQPVDGPSRSETLNQRCNGAAATIEGEGGRENESTVDADRDTGKVETIAEAKDSSGQTDKVQGNEDSAEKSGINDDKIDAGRLSFSEKETLSETPVVDGLGTIGGTLGKVGADRNKNTEDKDSEKNMSEKMSDVIDVAEERIEKPLLGADSEGDQDNVGKGGADENTVRTTSDMAKKQSKSELDINNKGAQDDVNESKGRRDPWKESIDNKTRHSHKESLSPADGRTLNTDTKKDREVADRGKHGDVAEKLIGTLDRAGGSPEKPALVANNTGGRVDLTESRRGEEVAVERTDRAEDSGAKPTLAGENRVGPDVADNHKGRSDEAIEKRNETLDQVERRLEKPALDAENRSNQDDAGKYEGDPREKISEVLGQADNRIEMGVLATASKEDKNHTEKMQEDRDPIEEDGNDGRATAGDAVGTAPGESVAENKGGAPENQRRTGNSDDSPERRFFDEPLKAQSAVDDGKSQTDAGAEVPKVRSDLAEKVDSEYPDTAKKTPSDALPSAGTKTTGESEIASTIHSKSGTVDAVAEGSVDVSRAQPKSENTVLASRPTTLEVAKDQNPSASQTETTVAPSGVDAVRPGPNDMGSEESSSRTTADGSRVALVKDDSDDMEIDVSGDADEKIASGEKTSNEPKQKLDLDNIKAMLFSLGRRVHRNRGYERLFVEYWNAMSQCLEGKRSKPGAAVTRFLRTKTLRKVHNRLVTGLLQRCMKSSIPSRKVSMDEVPRSWKSRIRPKPAPKVDDEPEPPRLEEKARPTPSRLLEPYTSVLSAREFTEVKHTSPSASSVCIPGAMIVDPFVRGLARAVRMDVSENAIWLLVVAMKEYCSAVLKGAITSVKALESGEVPPRSLIRPQTLGRRKSTSSKTSEPSATGNSIAATKCITALDVHALTAAMQIGSARSLGGSASRITFESGLFGSYANGMVGGGKAHADVSSFIYSAIAPTLPKRQRIEGKPSDTQPLSGGTASTAAPTDTAAGALSGQTRSGLSPTGGMGRGAKNLASLKARASATANRPTTAKPDASSGPSGAPSGLPQRANETAPATNVQAQQAQTTVPAPTTKPQQAVQQVAAPRKGKGSGVKNLAAMLARSREVHKPEGGAPDDNRPASSTGQPAAAAASSSHSASTSKTQERTPSEGPPQQQQPQQPLTNASGSRMPSARPGQAHNVSGGLGGSTAAVATVQQSSPSAPAAAAAASDRNNDSNDDKSPPTTVAPRPPERKGGKNLSALMKRGGGGGTRSNHPGGGETAAIGAAGGSAVGGATSDVPADGGKPGVAPPQQQQQQIAGATNEQAARLGSSHGTGESPSGPAQAASSSATTTTTTAIPTAGNPKDEPPGETTKEEP